MFPFIADAEEFAQARAMLAEQMEREAAMGHAVPTERGDGDRRVAHSSDAVIWVTVRGGT